MQLWACFVDWEPLQEEWRKDGPSMVIPDSDEADWIEDCPQTLECDSLILNEEVAEAFRAAQPALSPDAAARFEDFLGAFVALDNYDGYKPPQDVGTGHDGIMASFSPSSVSHYLKLYESLDSSTLTQALGTVALDQFQGVESAADVQSYIAMWGSILRDASNTGRGLIVS